MFVCGFCGRASSTCSLHLQHLKYHQNLSRNLHCGYTGCKKTFRADNLLRMHLIRYHRLKISAEKVAVKSKGVVADTNARFLCKLEFCRAEAYTYQNLIKHLKEHIRCGLTISCPYRGCTSNFDKLNSFTGHLSKLHKKSDTSDCSILSDISEPQQGGSGHGVENLSDLQGSWNENCGSSVNDSSNAVMEDSAEVLDENAREAFTAPINEDHLYLMNLAAFFLKLECQYLVPASTVQFIWEALVDLRNLEQHVRTEKMRTVLLNEKFRTDQVDRVLNFINQNDPFKEQCHKLKTDYKRKAFYKEYMNFVSPQEIRISGGARFHYVPILETCEAILNDPTLQLDLDIPVSKDNVLSDFTDGEVFRSNEFFRENPRSLRLILFEDSFTLTNPIGPARSDGKVLAVYLICGNIPLHQRSQVKRIFLVALCKEKDFNHSEVYWPMVRDFRKLQSVGVKNSRGEIVKGSLVVILGDNLGSNGLAGMVQNFSAAKFFCRFCLASREDIFGSCNHCGHSRGGAVGNEDSGTGSGDGSGSSQGMVEEAVSNAEGVIDHSEGNDSMNTSEDETTSKDGSEVDIINEAANEDDESEAESSDESDEIDIVSGIDSPSSDHATQPYRLSYYPARTPQNYDEALRKIGTGKHYMGVKFNSSFNELDHFHVCMPGLPPCLGHDGPEGVMTFDMPLFISHFVKNKWFSYRDLNRCITNFKYSPHDQRDKPKPVQKGTSRLVGGAWQIWTFTRLFPLIVKDYIKDAHDPVWVAMLLLTEIFEVICSPNIHVSFLPYLQDRINSYLSMRAELFKSVKLRPKHHFMYHYPWLIKKFGPLMRVFTLRCESKHYYFKRVIHAVRCFKNITLSLSEKHELLQAYVRAGGESNECDGVLDLSEFHKGAYSDSIIAAIDGVNLTGVILEGSSARVFGYHYRKNSLVVLRQNLYRYGVELGRIALILQDENERLYFVVDVVEVVFRPKLNLYQLGGHVKFECIAYHELYAQEPQDTYEINGVKFVKLTHGLVSNEL